MKRGVSDVDAWDILQNAFIKVFNRRETLPESVEQRKAILFGEVNVQMKAHFSEQIRSLDRAARARELIVFLGLTEQRDMARVLEARQLLELVLAEISADQYQIFTDKVLDDLTIREVAEQLNMNAHTAKTHWFRALASLKLKLENIEHRKGRGFIVLLAIAGILGLAKNARAMVELLKRFFRTIRQMHLHQLAGMATAGMIMLSPPNSGASVNDASSSLHNEAPANASIELAPLKMASDSEAGGKKAAASIADSPSPAAPLPQSKPRAPKKSTKQSAPPDYLISAAIATLRDGQPERALVLLDQYAATSEKAAKAGMVKTLRAEAQAAIVAR